MIFYRGRHHHNCADTNHGYDKRNGILILPRLLQLPVWRHIPVEIQRTFDRLSSKSRVQIGMSYSVLPQFFNFLKADDKLFVCKFSKNV